MQHTVSTGPLQGFTAAEQFGMFALRHEVFKVRLGWDVEVTEDGREIDQFDADEQARYIIGKSPAEHIDAHWRLLPTLGPYMLRDVFPQLLHGQPAPAAADVWELSRFAIATDRLASSEDAGNHQIGFGTLSVALMQESVRFARSNGIARYVTVTTSAIERMLVRRGLNVHRVGPPIKIGRVLTVACFIEIDDTTATALGM
ncbi:MAG TPA: acyl-homoserine-lactone synthase [Ramlibacter sp.]|nr:acyl-homoserine-lactone synthase [Ramlibacter sp.]